eukprot:GGOE01020994.1.p1 GENE.GGOE01020994.1~~GGOE01020994.1.p1  ORF type:complete len:369 (+),score=77.85 GGOE01020994.1:148-1107(+)
MSPGNRTALSTPLGEGAQFSPPEALLRSLRARPQTVRFQDFFRGLKTFDPGANGEGIVSVSQYQSLADATIGVTPMEVIRNRSLVFFNAASGGRVATLRQVLRLLSVQIFLLQCSAHAVFEDWLLRSPAVLLLFACNVPGALHNHTKVRIIPLGIPHGTGKQLTSWRRRLQVLRPTNEVFAQFSIRSPASRAKVRRKLLELLQRRKLLVLHGPYQRMSHDAYLKRMVHSRFVVCPRGIGPDTYRTWEALVLGRVPVVERLLHPFLYAGLPVVQLDSWQQLNSSLLAECWEAMQAQRVHIQKLSFTWWMWYIAVHAAMVP